MTNLREGLMRVAVAGRDGVYLDNALRLALPTFTQPDYWLAAMERRNIDVLWLHPGIGWGWRDTDIDACEHWTIRGGADGEQGEPWWTATREGAHGVRHVVQPAYEDRALWREAESAQALATSLSRFRAAMGLDWRRSPGATGTRLLRAVHRGGHATRLELDGKPPDVALTGATGDAGHLHYTRALDESERGYYLHAYDMNGQFLAACNGLACGVGRAEHHRYVTLPEKESEWPAGYFLVRLMPAGRARAAELAPAPVDADGASHWITTPTLRLLRAQRVAVQILQAWTWSQSRRYLDPWYTAIKRGRELVTDDALALDAVKGLYRHSIAWLESERWDRSEDTLYRPDWAQSIRAKARVLMLMSVYRVGANFGIWPLAIGADCVYYVAPQSLAATLPFVRAMGPRDTPEPTDGLRVSSAIGHFKLKDTGIPVESVTRYLGGADWNLGALQHRLNVLAGRRAASVAEVM